MARILVCMTSWTGIPEVLPDNEHAGRHPGRLVHLLLKAPAPPREAHVIACSSLAMRLYQAVHMHPFWCGTGSEERLARQLDHRAQKI